jgi:hypothetical protein
LKGNVFSALHIDSLKQVVADVKLQLGNNALEAQIFIDRLIAEEKMNYDTFVGITLRFFYLQTYVLR